MKELLDAVLELIGFFPPDVFDPRPIMHQRAVLHRGLELGVIEAIEFESEKQEVRRGGGDALLHVGVEFAARGIGGVASVDQPGKGREPPKKVIERLIALYCLGQPLSTLRSIGQRCELAVIITLNGETFSRTTIEITRYARVSKPRIKIGQVPFRQGAQTGHTGHARTFSRSTSGDAFKSYRHIRLRRGARITCRRQRRTWIWCETAAGQRRSNGTGEPTEQGFRSLARFRPTALE